MKERKWQPIWYKSCTNFYCHLIQKKHKTIWQAFDKLYTSKRSRQPRDSAAHFTEFCSLIILHKIKRPDAAYFKVRPSVPYFSCWIGCAHVVHFWSFDNGAGKLRESPVHWTSTWTWVRSELSEKQTLIVHCGEFGEGSFKKQRKKNNNKKNPRNEVKGVSLSRICDVRVCPSVKFRSAWAIIDWRMLSHSIQASTRLMFLWSVRRAWAATTSG